ncbi:MAG TPA: TIM barrel protein [Planctomycetaceae bacterium]
MTRRFRSSRRRFLVTLASAAGSAALSRPVRAAEEGGDLHIACQEYPWGTLYRREGRETDLEAALAGAAKAGLDGWEPIATSPEQIARLGESLRRHGLAMRSLYVNSTLHDAKAAGESVRQVLDIADAAKPLGTSIVVTNPSPIRWGGDEAKTDEQLIVQAKQFDRLGAALRDRGLTLAYHNHDVELRHAAREFHHMLAGTDAGHVAFCLDAHWVYRGSGDSQVALFDAVTLYGRRVVELHLRQSRGGVWTEAFGEGDIDYPRLRARLAELGVPAPHLVLEQSVEAGTPKSLTPVEAHRRGREYAAAVFG